MSIINYSCKRHLISTSNLLRHVGRTLLAALLLVLFTNFQANAQKGGGHGGGGGGGGGGQCNPNNPHYDPCLCGDPACNVPLDSWVGYLAAGIVIFGFLRLKNQPLNTNKAA